MCGAACGRETDTDSIPQLPGLREHQLRSAAKNDKFLCFGYWFQARSRNILCYSCTLQHAWCKWRSRTGVQQSMKCAMASLLGSFPHSSLWQSSMGPLLAQDPVVCKGEFTAKIIQVTMPRIEYSARMESAKDQPYRKERVSPPMNTAKAFSPRVLFAIGSPQHPRALLAKLQKPH